MRVVVVDVHSETTRAHGNCLSDAPLSINSKNFPSKLPAQQQA
jgi:hypothetical protein